jgi:hypothetical protein
VSFLSATAQLQQQHNQLLPITKFSLATGGSSRQIKKKIGHAGISPAHSLSPFVAMRQQCAAKPFFALLKS